MLALLALLVMRWAAAQGAGPLHGLPSAEALSHAEVFSAWFAGLLNDTYPHAQAAVLSPLVVKAKAGGGRSITVALDRFFTACRRPPQDRARCYRRVSSYLPNILPGKDGSPVTPAAIVALVRTREYLAKAAAASPDDLDRQPVARHLVGPLWVLYAYDNSQGSGLLTASQYKALHFNRDELDLVAMKNLQRLLGPLEMGASVMLQDQGVQVINDGNPYESSRLLLYEQWQALAQRQQAPLLASVPVQDALLYTTSGAAAALRDLDKRLLRQGSFPVSPAVLRWTSTGWVEER